MKTICFYFQIHQPFRLKRYRFFDIGNDHYYYDDFANDDIITRIAQRSYLPANATLLEMIKNANGNGSQVPRRPLHAAADHSPAHRSFRSHNFSVPSLNASDC
jgi:hypothetical protein